MAQESDTGTHASSTKAKVLDVLSLISRLALAFVWIFAGISKTSDRLGTVQSIEGYDIFSPTWVDWIALAIGPLELIGGFMLLLGIFLRQAGKVSAVVLVLFIVGIAQAWARGLSIDCGCFGAASPDEAHMDYLLTILRDMVFIAMSMMCAYRPYRRFALHV